MAPRRRVKNHHRTTAAMEFLSTIRSCLTSKIDQYSVGSVADSHQTWDKSGPSRSHNRMIDWRTNPTFIKRIRRFSPIALTPGRDAGRVVGALDGEILNGSRPVVRGSRRFESGQRRLPLSLPSRNLHGPCLLAGSRGAPRFVKGLIAGLASEVLPFCSLLMSSSAACCFDVCSLFFQRKYL